jgi:uncharacterized repeat protein (TIGR03803 family)
LMKNAPLLSTLQIPTLALNLFAALALIVAFAQPASAQTETVLYSFCPKGGWCAGGAGPESVIADSAGDLYGVTFRGGTGVGGIAFKMTPSGQESLLYNFTREPYNGWQPEGQLILDKQGNLYGTTSSQGNLYGTTYRGGAYHGPYFGGTVFKLSPGSNGSWNETILYNFGQQTGGCVNPWSNVLFDAKGNLHGTASYGGTWGGGCAYELSPAGKLTLLHAFGEGADASFPSGTIMFYRGSLYGAAGGGAYAEGAVFKIKP